jgi:eukaryotic-like serine/threonine-protein kinase
MPTSTPDVFAETMEMTPDGNPVAEAEPGRAVELVAGSQPSFSGEIRDLLRDRLRLASLILFFGYLAYLIKELLIPSPRVHETDSMVVWKLAAVVAVTGLVAIRLCLNCRFFMRKLRLAELLVFGSSTLLFISAGYVTLIHAAPRGYLIPISTPFLILIFTYALFIPNTWQRALAVIAPMAAAPMGILLYCRVAYPEVATVMRENTDFRDAFLESSMVMILGTIVAVWGVRTLRTLRAEAFEARQMGQYRLLRPLGKGGMGEVYLAEHLLLKRPCAIKLIRPDRTGDPGALARFEREVQSTARLTHWNTIEIFDYGRAEDGTFYYVMEYLPGMNLDDLIEMHGPMPPGRAIYLLTQACDALQEAHEHGLVHRDIKPGNVFAARRGGAFDVTKLLDFGLVRSEQQLNVKLTYEGVVTGSPQFMSPEQARGDAVDERGDIYSLGGVAYFLLTGRPPFEAPTPIKLILAHAQNTVTPLRELNPGLPADLEQVILRCLAKDPQDRFQNVQELRQALHECRDSGTWSRELAEQWWRAHGCPKKKELDACIDAGHIPDLDPETELTRSGILAPV